MKFQAACLAFLAVLFGAANANAATSTVTVSPSRLTFSQAMSACPGAMGTVTFTLGHARVASMPDVLQWVDTSSAGIDTITFGNGKTGQRAVATTNGHNNTVTAKNVQLKSRNQVACVMAE
jgi:hypothetical protein